MVLLDLSVVEMKTSFAITASVRAVVRLGSGLSAAAAPCLSSFSSVIGQVSFGNVLSVRRSLSIEASARNECRIAMEILCIVHDAIFAFSSIYRIRLADLRLSVDAP